jgi:hypothetical protein
VKYLISILITALVVGAGVVAYFKGWLSLPPNQKPQAVMTQNTDVTNNTAPTTTPSSFTTVKAGGILALKQYSINIPNDWAYSKDGSTLGQIDKLNLTKGNYKVVFTEAAMGGGGCVFPGDPQGPMGTIFDSYTEIITSTGEKFRLGVSPDNSAEICENVDGAWGDLTEIGHVDITFPAGSSADMISQVTPILASIKILPSSESESNQTILDAVKAAMVAKHGSDFSGLTYSLDKTEGDYASGSVGGTGGGGMWFAAKVNGTWTIVWDGNGSIMCSDLTAYPNFPADMIPECLDASNNTVKR